MIRTITLLAFMVGNGPTNPGQHIQLTSSAFHHRGTIPIAYTCQDKDLSPPLRWRHVPPGTESLALVMTDKDGPNGGWHHWVVYNISPRLHRFNANTQLAEGEQVAKNTWGNTRYQGPCPQKGTHRYVFRLFALGTRLPIDGGVSVEQLYQAMRGHVLAIGTLEGNFNVSAARNKTRLHKKNYVHVSRGSRLRF